MRYDNDYDDAAAEEAIIRGTMRALGRSNGNGGGSYSNQRQRGTPRRPKRSDFRQQQQRLHAGHNSSVGSDGIMRPSPTITKTIPSLPNSSSATATMSLSASASSESQQQQQQYQDQQRSRSRSSYQRTRPDPNPSCSFTPRSHFSSQFSRQSQSSSSSSSSSLKLRFKRTGEYCANGHELIQIPTADRRRYLQRKQFLLMASSTSRSAGAMEDAENDGNAIVIECDCCSRNIDDDTDECIAACCLECDIDLCSNCYQNGQSVEDVLLKESREEDVEDELERTELRKLQRRNDADRYNGVRPTYADTGRVSYDDYPDPTAFQWEFTGEGVIECGGEGEAAVGPYPVEYFEKDFGKQIGIVRLDFYYSIGTVTTTSIGDGISGGGYYKPRELFSSFEGGRRRKISGRSYRNILKDPRSYTNERYHKKNSSSNSTSNSNNNNNSNNSNSSFSHNNNRNNNGNYGRNGSSNCEDGIFRRRQEPQGRRVQQRRVEFYEL